MSCAGLTKDSSNATFPAPVATDLRVDLADSTNTFSAIAFSAAVVGTLPKIPLRKFLP